MCSFGSRCCRGRRTAAAPLSHWSRGPLPGRMTKSNKATGGKAAKAGKGPATPQQVAVALRGLKMGRRRRPAAAKAIGTPGSFAVAARAPFSRAAEGVRLPDGNPNLSSTLALTRKIQVQSDANGEVDLTVLPNLYCTAFTTRGNISGGGTTIALAGTSSSAGTITGTTTTTTARGVGFDVESLKAQYSRYRIVSYGVRVRATAGVSATGEFLCAALPLKGQTPFLTDGIPGVNQGQSGTSVGGNTYWGVAGPRSTMENMLLGLGLPSTGSDNAAKMDFTKLANSPAHAIASAAQVAARGLHARGLPYEAQARDYMTTAYSAIGTDSLDVASTVGNEAGSTYAVQQYGVDMSCFRVGGTESIVISGSGFSTTSVIGTIEIVYHVEAMPNPQYSLLVRPTGRISSTPTGQTLDQVLVHLHKIPRFSFSDVVQTVGDSMLGELEGRAATAGAGAVSSLAGMLGRLMTAAV